MREAAAGERFEEAARVRDQLRAVERTLERQRMVQEERVDQDVFGVHRAGPHLAVAVLVVRRGRLQDSQTFNFVKQEFPTEELLASFLGLYYDGATSAPAGAAPGAVRWRTRQRLRSGCPRRPASRSTCWRPSGARRSGWSRWPAPTPSRPFRERESQGQDVEEMLARLQRALELRKLPRTLECYDISNFQGTEVVGSKVAFRDGQPEQGRLPALPGEGRGGAGRLRLALRGPQRAGCARASATAICRICW